MSKIEVLNQLGEKVENITISDKVFKIEPNMQVVYDCVKAERAALRQGTHKTKTRTEVNGGGKKPWRQKGTGRARQGSIRSPQWVGGGVVFGPTPRNYDLKVNKKVKKLAVKSLLSDRFIAGNLLVVDSITLDEFKTKKALEVLKALKINDKKTIIITDEENFNLETATKNIPTVYVQTKDHLSIYDLIRGDVYVLFKNVVKKYEEDLK